MHVCGPVAIELRVIGLEVDTAEITGQCVEPHVKDVRWIVRQRDSPLQRSAADRQIFEAASDKRRDFIPSRLGPDEVRILLVKLEKAILERGKFEKVALFLEPFRLSSTVRTIWRRRRIAFRSVGLARHAVPAGVLPFVDIAGLFSTPVNLAHADVM